MGWNEPNDNKNNNPWGAKKDKQGPPDLDELLRQFQNKLNKLFGGKLLGDGSGPENKKKMIWFGVVVALAIYALSGIYIVRPAERSVVLTFGKYTRTVGSGPHWIAPFIQSKTVVDVSEVLTSKHIGQMLTRDENIVVVELVVQYRIGDLQDYLFNVVNPVYSLQEATDSAMRSVIGHSTLDQVLTSGRQEVRQQIREQIEAIIGNYHSGLLVVDVSMQPARAPEQVKEAFDDAINAQEDEQRSINQATAYEKRVIPEAQGQARRVVEEAKAYRDQVILKAKGESERFLELLTPYQQAKQVTRERLYLQMMEQVLDSTSKVIVDTKQGNSLMYLPIDKLMQQGKQTSGAAALKSGNSISSTISQRSALESSAAQAERNRQAATSSVPRDVTREER